MCIRWDKIATLECCNEYPDTGIILCNQNQNRQSTEKTQSQFLEEEALCLDLRIETLKIYLFGMLEC